MLCVMALVYKKCMSFGTGKISEQFEVPRNTDYKGVIVGRKLVYKRFHSFHINGYSSFSQ